ncbi:MAG: HD domain-containing protein [Bacteroidota bacterium]
MFVKEAVSDQVFIDIQAASQKTGLSSYVIGGYVRDFLLGTTSKDIDVVVEGRGIELAQAFADIVGAKEVIIFENFGTAMVKAGEYEVEFVGARKESYQRSSRKPVVEEGSLEDDQLRRDFTVNALSISLQSASFGKLHDPFNGVEDLKNGLIRTPTDPDITFSDDPLRMLRAIRFATRLNFSISEETYLAIKRNSSRLSIISMERIHEELNKTLMASTPSRGLDLMFKTGLLELFFPELATMYGVEYVNGRGHKDNFYHTLKVLDNVSSIEGHLWMRWVALLHDIAKPLTKRYDAQLGWTFHGHEDKGARMVPRIFRRLKLPLNEKMKYVQKLVKLHQRPIALVNEEVSDSAIRRLIVEAGEDLDDLLDFCRCDITSRNERKVKQFLTNYEMLESRIREVEERDHLRNWQPPVDGNTIMETFNIGPGREVGQIKQEIREAILEGVIPNDRSAAIEFMHQIAPKYLKA